MLRCCTNHKNYFSKTIGTFQHFKNSIHPKLKVSCIICLLQCCTSQKSAFPKSKIQGIVRKSACCIVAPAKKALFQKTKIQGIVRKYACCIVAPAQKALFRLIFDTMREKLLVAQLH